MTRHGFRKLILVWWLVGIICVVVTLATNRYLPTELRNYQEALYAEPTAGDWIVIGVGFLVLVSSVVVSVGLYRLRQWASTLLLPIHIVALILIPFYGPSVMSGWAYALCYLYSLLTGGLLFLVYLSPVSQMFETREDVK